MTHREHGRIFPRDRPWAGAHWHVAMPVECPGAPSHTRCREPHRGQAPQEGFRPETSPLPWNIHGGNEFRELLQALPLCERVQDTATLSQHQSIEINVRVKKGMPKTPHSQWPLPRHTEARTRAKGPRTDLGPY